MKRTTQVAFQTIWRGYHTGLERVATSLMLGDKRVFRVTEWGWGALDGAQREAEACMRQLKRLAKIASRHNIDTFPKDVDNWVLLPREE